MCVVLQGRRGPRTHSSPASPGQGHIKGISSPSTRETPWRGQTPLPSMGDLRFQGLPSGAGPESCPHQSGHQEPLAAPKAVVCNPSWPNHPVNGSGATAPSISASRQAVGHEIGLNGGVYYSRGESWAPSGL